jgi:MOSC domain-containing protein YiiM
VNARVTRIFLRPSARTPVKQVERVTAFAGMGLEGDHAGGGNRQVTLLSEESGRAACSELGKTELDPGLRRANLVIEGIELGAAIGKALRIGLCRIRIVAETRPYRLMDDAEPGLQNALDPDRRGGVYGRVMEGGLIETGAAVAIEEIFEPGQTDLPFGAEQ